MRRFSFWLLAVLSLFNWLVFFKFFSVVHCQIVPRPNMLGWIEETGMVRFKLRGINPLWWFSIVFVVWSISILLTFLTERYELVRTEDWGYLLVQKGPKPEPDLPSKIQKLTKSLNTASDSMRQIEVEIEKRQELVRELEKQADTASKITTLNKEQRDAVAQLLRDEIKSDERQNFWTAQLLAFFYAALGVALSEAYRYAMRWRARRRLEGPAVIAELDQ